VKTLLAAWGAALVTMMVLDALWLGFIAKPLYQQGIGHLMADKPLILAVVAFYLVYATGIVAFTVWPQLATTGWTRSALLGAGFGLVAYATYDLSNLATLRGWPLGLSFIDIAWGTAISAASATASKLVADRFAS
jgi:uncharacterized membrane protein